MQSPNEVTFIIPVYNLEEHRIRNLKYILPYIIATKCKVIISEQVTGNTSDISDVICQYPEIKHVLYRTTDTKFHKTGIINYAVKNHVNTKYAWVTDTDFYMRFDQVFNNVWHEKFIQPYEIAKKLNENDSEVLISGARLNVNFADTTVRYISMYGALSFIFDVEEFLLAGAMDETIYGWGYEDVELSKRIKQKYDIQTIKIKGIHLWHPVEFEKRTQEPECREMAVICCHFNWCGYKNPTRNLHRFLTQMKAQKIPLYGVELSLTDEFATKNMANWKHMKVGPQNICFQKEACLNIAEKMVPPQYRKIAWIDPDLFFYNKNWYIEAVELLDKHKVIQLFSQYLPSDRNGKTDAYTPSMMKRRSEGTAGLMGVPGGALAARRELWSVGSGLYPYCFIGGGDSVFLHAINDIDKNNQLITKILKTPFGEHSKAFTNWKKNALAYVNKDVGFLEGSVYHEWHGDSSDRGYVSRHEILNSIDISKNIKLNSEGVVEICDVNLEVYFKIMNYFKDRREDG